MQLQGDPFYSKRFLSSNMWGVTGLLTIKTHTTKKNTRWEITSFCIILKTHTWYFTPIPKKPIVSKPLFPIQGQKCSEDSFFQRLIFFRVKYAYEIRHILWCFSTSSIFLLLILFSKDNDKSIIGINWNRNDFSNFEC